MACCTVTSARTEPVLLRGHVPLTGLSWEIGSAQATELLGADPWIESGPALVTELPVAVPFQSHLLSLSFRYGLALTTELSRAGLACAGAKHGPFANLPLDFGTTLATELPGADLAFNVTGPWPLGGLESTTD